MLEVVALVVASGTSCFMGYRLGFRRAKVRSTMWFVQPAPTSLQRRTPDPTDPAPTVLDAVFVRTNLPNSDSIMER